MHVVVIYKVSVKSETFKNAYNFHIFSLYGQLLCAVVERHSYLSIYWSINTLTNLSRYFWSSILIHNLYLSMKSLWLRNVSNGKIVYLNWLSVTMHAPSLIYIRFYDFDIVSYVYRISISIYSTVKSVKTSESEVHFRFSMCLFSLNPLGTTLFSALPAGNKMKPFVGNVELWR